MKRLILLLFLLHPTWALQAQHVAAKDSVVGRHKKDTVKWDLPKNSFYVEVFGNAFNSSINYERVLFNKKWFYLTCRTGGF